MKLFFIAALALSFSQSAFAHDHAETPISDLIEGAEIAASLYIGTPETALAIEADRYPENNSPFGVSVRLLTRAGANAVATQEFACSYAEGREISECNSQKKKEGEGPFALMLASIEALNEAAPEASLPLAAITLVKAWPAPRRGHTYVRAAYESQALGAGSVVFTCHKGGHGDPNHTDCHFLSQNATGPNEPIAVAR